MPHFPTYIALTIDKLLTGYVSAAKQFQNNKAIKETAIASLQMEHYRGPTLSFYHTMTTVEDYRENKMVWDVVPDYIPNVLHIAKKARTKPSVAQTHDPAPAPAPAPLSNVGGMRNHGGPDRGDAGRGGEQGDGGSDDGHGGRGGRGGH